MKLVKTLALATLAALGLSGAALAAGSYKHPHGPHHGFAWEDPFFGTYDRAAMQRGFQVYKQFCSNCHGLKFLSYRNLGEQGAPFFDAEYPNANDNPVVRAIAAEKVVTFIDQETGQEAERAAIPSDRFVSPYANEAAARATFGGAYPPDLSVIAAARHYRTDYLYSLLTGYPEEAPAGLTVPAGQYYNPYFPGDVKANWSGDPKLVPVGGMLAMAPPLVEGALEYQDGTEATVEQMAYDVVSFLKWASDPHMEQRKQMGLVVLIFLTLLAVLLYMSYRQIWRNVEH
jgi:ubiquinol-cytochrome c reductase cytochrome c1 subunit